MKKYLIYIIALLCTACVLDGCKEVEPQEEPLPPEISVKETDPYAKEEGSYSISYTVKNPVEGVILEVYTEEDWIVDLEADEEDISFTLLENEEKDERSGNIELTYEGAEPVNLPIRQKGNGPEIMASKPKEFEYNGGQGTITYSIENPVSGGNLKASTEDNWITGITVTAEEVRFTVGTNASDKARTGQIKLEYEKAKTLKVPIKQSGYKGEKTDLSMNGTANCYIVSGPGFYMFPAVKGNGSESVGTVSSVEVLWETFGTDIVPTKGELIATTQYESSGNKITFITGGSDFKKGNASIAAKDASGNILWSWHIWFTDKPEDQVYLNDAGTMMDRNLGATSATPGDVGALGLLYQWGRKDPFLGSSSITGTALAKSTGEWPAPVKSDASTGTLEYATANPTTFISSKPGGDWYYLEDGGFNSTSWLTEKTIYDPCPPGYRIPDGGSETIWSKALNTSEYLIKNPSFDALNNGNNFGSSGDPSLKFCEDTDCWYPIIGLIECDGVFTRTYQSSYFWANGVLENSTAALALFTSYIGPAASLGTSHHAWGASVRCQKQ